MLQERPYHVHWTLQTEIAERPKMDVTETKIEDLAAIALRCHKARIKPAELCERAGVARTTYWRAKKRPETVTVDTLRKLEDELARIEAERKA